MLQFKFQHRLDWLTQRFASGFCIPHPKIIRQKQTWVGGVMVSDVGYDSGDCSDDDNLIGQNNKHHDNIFARKWADIRRLQINKNRNLK